MRKINKDKEPRQLTAYRCLPGANYAGFRDNVVLSESLVQEQLGLCCYCMRRIRPNTIKKKDMKIEHCLSQEDREDQALNYGNLLGACKGGEGSRPNNQHCDTKKGSHSLSFNPADPHFDLEAQIKFLGDGTIYSENPTIEDELGEGVLNLNLAELKAGRKAVLVAFQTRLQHGRKLNYAKELQNWDGSQGTELPPYAQVVAAYLRKKLK